MAAWTLHTAVALVIASLSFSASASQSSVGSSSIPLAQGVSLGQGRVCRNAFRVLPYLTHVTSSAIRVNMIPDESFDLKVTLSLADSPTWGSAGTGVSTNPLIASAVTADTRTHLVAAPTATFTGLAAGTLYKYLVECRTNASSPWQMVQQATFKTFETNAAATVRVAVIADDHTTSLYLRQKCQDANELATSALTGRSLKRLDLLALTVSNILSAGPDYIVDLGDTALIDNAASVDCSYTRENGTVVTIPNQGFTTAEQELMWEIPLVFMQPMLAYYPTFFLVGNHEAIHGYGGAGANILCPAVSGFSENQTNNALTTMKAMLGNYNDAYNNGTNATDFDGDTVLEDERDGIYFEFASGSLRWFSIDNLRYTADTGPAGAVPAAQFAGFVARTADQPAATYGTCPNQFMPLNGTDSYEDNATLGGTETGWLISRMTAATEAFMSVASHRVTGGFTPGNPYFYQRGLITTRDDDGDGKREVGESWDPDGDGNVMDEKYIADLMIAQGAQIRFTGHDHFHEICRKGGIHYMLVGTPSCSAGNGSNVDGGCTNNWYLPLDVQTAHGDVQAQWLSAAGALFDSYDCDEDGANDADPLKTNSGLNPRAVANNGINGTNGTYNRGFGLLTVNGNTNMQWQWIVSDPFDLDRNNDRIVTYGPINP